METVRRRRGPGCCLQCWSLEGVEEKAHSACRDFMQAGLGRAAPAPGPSACAAPSLCNSSSVTVRALTTEEVLSFQRRAGRVVQLALLSPSVSGTGMYHCPLSQTPARAGSAAMVEAFAAQHANITPMPALSRCM